MILFILKILKILIQTKEKMRSTIRQTPLLHFHLHRTSLKFIYIYFLDVDMRRIVAVGQIY
jgi:hypothetical protein